MVHLGGRIGQRLATSGWRVGTSSLRQASGGTGASRRSLKWVGGTLLAALITVLASGTASPAAAQSAIGFQGGVTADPEQVFGGVFFQSGDIGRGIRLRPGVDGAIGQGLRIATIDLDFIYGYPLGGNGWTFLAGGGPAVVVTRFKDFDERDTGVGFHSIVGFGHESGFFTELRLGSGRAQQLKFGVGWAITLD